MQIQKNTVVGMHYTLKNDNGDIIDSSEGKDPLVFLQGSGQIIQGLDEALIGKQVGDKLEVIVEPEKGYGPHREELIQDVPRNAFQGVEDIQVGMQFQAQTDGGPIILQVIEIKDDTISVDGNHMLAGQRLHFSVSIESTRAASAEEIDHGHVH